MATKSRNASSSARQRVVRAVRREEDECWICHKPVDFSLKYPHPMSASVDEVVPVSLGGSPYDRSNCRLAHLRCNEMRGNGTRPTAEQRASFMALGNVSIWPGE